MTKTAKEDDGNPMWNVTNESVIRFPQLRAPLVEGMEFGTQGRLICKVGAQGTDGFQVIEGRMYTLQLVDLCGTLLAEVYRNNVKGMGDNYTIQIRRSDTEHRTFLLRQSPLGGAYTLKDENDQVILFASNQAVPPTLLCCAPCLVAGCCNFTIAYTDDPQKPGGGRNVLIERNQTDETIRVAAGQSPLLAICVAYATDRLLSV